MYHPRTKFDARFLQVLAGALRDNGRAVYVGERSFGKGVIQYYFPMTDGSGLKLTVAKYLTPTKYDIAARSAAAHLLGIDPVSRLLMSPPKYY